MRTDTDTKSGHEQLHGPEHRAPEAEDGTGDGRQQRDRVPQRAGTGPGRVTPLTNGTTRSGEATSAVCTGPTPTRSPGSKGSEQAPGQRTGPRIGPHLPWGLSPSRHPNAALSTRRRCCIQSGRGALKRRPPYRIRSPDRVHRTRRSAAGSLVPPRPARSDLAEDSGRTRAPRRLPWRCGPA
jgi:hypothetical protein